MTSTYQPEKSNITPFSGKTFLNQPAGNPKRVVSKCHVQITRKINPMWTVDRLFGKRHWANQWVIRLCESDPQFLLHLIDQSSDYVHFICLVRLALLEQSVNEENQLGYAERIRTQNKKKTLQSLSPSCPAGILGVLPKLPTKPLSQKCYRQLIRVMANDSLCKYFRHTMRVRKFDMYLVELLENIPKEFRVRGVFNCIKEFDDYEALLVLTKVAQTLNIEIAQQEVDMATREMDEFEQIEKWFKRKFAMLPFPSPPWRGNEWIKPACSRSEMQDVADKFKNCVMRYVVEVILGYSYFYVCERTSAVIQVRQSLLGCWVVHEIERSRRVQRRVQSRYCRRRAQNISRVEEREIMQVFADAGFLPIGIDKINYHLVV